MQFSDTSTKQGIVEDISFLLGLDINAYPLADRTRNANQRMAMVWQMIFESYGGWQFMDDNVSDATTGIPYANQNLTSGTGLYVLPTGSLTINQVSILNSGGNRENLVPITYEEFQKMGADAGFTSNSTPHYYILQGDVIRLLPIPNYSSTNGLRIYFDQGMSNFTAADTTKVPGFASIFHRMISIGAALDYALARGLTERVTYLQNLWNDYEIRLKEFYSKRWKDRMPHRISAGRDLVGEYS
jgi:hypothetical protein